MLPAQKRNPEITSSKTRRAPCFRVSSRAACRNSRVAGRQPPDAEKGLEDEAGHAAAVLREHFFQHLHVVEAGDDHLVGNPVREPPALLLLEAVRAFRVVVHADETPRLRAVPAAADLHHCFPAGEPAREERGVHRGQ